MSCPHGHLDGAYVLGALSPGERQEFEQHMLGCEECSRSVRELAGLPGLLAQVEVADLEPLDVPPVPETLMPALVREVRTAQRRRSALVASVAAAVAALAVAGLTVGGSGGGTPLTAPAPSSTAASATPTPPSAVPMAPVGPSPVRAEVVLASVAWGTRVDITCSYEDEEDEEEYEARPDATYALVVTGRDGRSEQVATWHGLPGRTMRLSAATATRQGDIASIEMRTTDGLVVLRLAV
jgi:Putative zinc-finger